MTRRLAPWLALVAALPALFLASWIVIPAPTYALLTFGVGAREVSMWIALGAILGLLISLYDLRRSRTARVAAACGIVALGLAVSPFVRLPSTIARFDAASRAMSAEPRAPRRARPLVVADLFRGIRSAPVTITHGIPFANRGGVRLALDVYRPRESQPRSPTLHPIIVQIYGGAWQRGDPSANADFARWIASAGYVVVAIDYRHAPAVHWPALLDDVDSSLGWVRDHARLYGGDTSRVVLMGRSAGGHLALMAAYSPAPVTVRAVISYYGPTELPESYRHPPVPDPLDIRACMEALLGGTLEQMPDRYTAASPTSLATRPQPPTLLVYGAADHIVQAKYGALLRDKLAATGTSVTYLEIPWAEHAFDAVFNGPSSQLALYYTERFLAWATR